MDVTTVDLEDGKPWGFNNPQKRANAKAVVEGKAVLAVAVSPMCAVFS